MNDNSRKVTQERNMKLISYYDSLIDKGVLHISACKCIQHTFFLPLRKIVDILKSVNRV